MLKKTDLIFYQQILIFHVKFYAEISAYFLKFFKIQYLQKNVFYIYIYLKCEQATDRKQVIVL